MSILEELERSFRIVDAFDIALVAVFVYAVLAWFKHAASRSVLVGVILLALVYFIARALDMYMTVAIFQGVFAVLLVALVVIFQEDLRRGFERLAALGSRSRRRVAMAAPDLDTLVEMAFQLAEKKVGALIVIRGEEPLDRHLDGGVPVRGGINKLLLDSIFDPHSLGHDGAVIIDREGIAQFAVHLPLSKNLKQVGARGMRHSAALGLSEVSDALTIVVSEERGEVSVAEGAKLQTVGSAAELRQRLDRFWQRHFQKPAQSVLSRLLKEDAGLKAASLLLAGLAWFLLSYRVETVQKTFDVPIEYRNLPKSLALGDRAPNSARITLSGLERAFNLLAPSSLKVSIDLDGAKPGRQQIVIEDVHVTHPSNLTLFGVEPRTLVFQIHRWVPVEVPVEVPQEGRLAEGLELQGVRTSPDRVRLRVWESERAFHSRIRTEPVDLATLRRPVELEKKLILPGNVQLTEGQPGTVRVTVNVVPVDAPRVPASPPPAEKGEPE